MPEAVFVARQLGATPEEIGGQRDYQGHFRKDAPSDEVALLRYEHYLRQRNSKPA